MASLESLREPVRVRDPRKSHASQLYRVDPTTNTSDAGIAIMIRCHGAIPLFFAPDEDRTHFESFAQEGAENATFIDTSRYNVENLTMFTLSPLNGSCTGYNRIDEFAQEAYSFLKRGENPVRTLREKMDMIFSFYAPEVLRAIRRRIFGKTIPLDIQKHVMNGMTLNKIYTNESPYSGIIILGSQGISRENLQILESELEVLSDTLKIPGAYKVTKREIFRILRPFRLNQVFYVDLTCSVYKNMIRNATGERVPISAETTEWITDRLNENTPVTSRYGTIRGGTKRKRKHKNRV